MIMDSVLVRNIRPSILIVLTVYTIAYTLVPVFKTFTNEFTVNAYLQGLSAVTGLDMVVYAFYFGSRGLEKIANIFKKAPDERGL